MSRYRTGGSVGITLYIDGKCVGSCTTPENAQHFADAANERDRYRAALDQIARVAKACVIDEVETYGKPVGDYDEIQGLAEDALNPTDAQERGE